MGLRRTSGVQDVQSFTLDLFWLDTEIVSPQGQTPDRVVIRVYSVYPF